MSEIAETLPADGKHVVMLVSNPCDPDYRVTKEAESLVRAGYRVTVLCTWKPGAGVPARAEINGVLYLRRQWNPIAVLKGVFGRIGRYSEIPRLDRGHHRKIVDRARRDK